MTKQDWQARYISKIRNTAKQTYAVAYLKWLRSGQVGLEPDHPGIGAMAAQSVRHALHLN